MLSSVLLHQQPSHRQVLRQEEHQPLEIIIITMMRELELTSVKLTALSWDHSHFQLMLPILTMFRSVSFLV